MVWPMSSSFSDCASPAPAAGPPRGVSTSGAPPVDHEHDRDDDSGLRPERAPLTNPASRPPPSPNRARGGCDREWSSGPGWCRQRLVRRTGLTDSGERRATAVVEAVMVAAVVRGPAPACPPPLARSPVRHGCRPPQVAAERLHRLISPGYVSLQRMHTIRSISAVASGRLVAPERSRRTRFRGARRGRGPM